MTETATEAQPETAEAPAAAAPAVKKAPQSITRTLKDASKNELQFIGLIRKDGTVDTYVNHRQLSFDDKGKSKLVKGTRGGTEKHADLDKAKKAMDAAVKLAVKEGWVERQAGGGGAGFKAKPDAFSITSLPKPAAAGK